MKTFLKPVDMETSEDDKRLVLICTDRASRGECWMLSKVDMV